MSLATNELFGYPSQMSQLTQCSPTDHAASAPTPPLAPRAVRDRAARMLRAAGDVERLALLEHLAAGERCVSELVALTGDAMPTVSQRLKQLRTEGLLVSRREGKHVFYALADQHVRTLVHDILQHAAEGLVLR